MKVSLRVDKQGQVSKTTNTNYTVIWLKENLCPVEDDVTFLKVHKIENFFGSEFEFYTISLLVMLKY